jgi:ribosomal protein S18 acetylase RimI-like enzyme
MNGGLQNIQIIKLPPEKWQLFKELRLESLEAEPQAFGQSYDEALKQNDDIWKTKLLAAEEGISFWMFFASKDGQLIGSMNARQLEGEKLRHVAEIHGVYVKKEYRGMGVAKKIMETLVAEISKNPTITKIKLTANTEQTAAIKLYESFGFRILGKAEKELNVNGSYVDEYFMEKLLLP